MSGIGKLVKAGAKVAKKVATKTDAGKAIHNLKAAKKDAAMMKHLERKYPAIADKDSISVINKTQTHGNKFLKIQESKWVLKPDNTKKCGVRAVKEIVERPMKTQIGIKGQSAKYRQHNILRLRRQDRIDNAKKYGKTAAAKIGGTVSGTSAIAGISSIRSKNKQRQTVDFGQKLESRGTSTLDSGMNSTSLKRITREVPAPKLTAKDIKKNAKNQINGTKAVAKAERKDMKLANKKAKSDARNAAVAKAERKDMKKLANKKAKSDARNAAVAKRTSERNAAQTARVAGKAALKEARIASKAQRITEKYNKKINKLKGANVAKKRR